jgi:16S rRNA (cytosine1402-N4)-methyltransferase
MSDVKVHLPVMEKEVVTAFSEQPKTPVKFLDGTFGRGGHTRALLNKFPKAKVFGFDRDAEALEFAKKEFSNEIKADRLAIVHDDFRNFADHNLGPFDGALFDLGVSSPQFDEAERGFSIQNDGPLDMRMDRRQTTTAADIINTSSEKELSDIFFQWGEIRHPNRVVRAIVHDRQTEPFTRTRQLSSLIDRVEKAGLAKKGSRRGRDTHFATAYFMALRIVVNQELENLAPFFETVPNHIEEGGRVVVISFHSLEDRIIKWVFRSADKVQGRIITKKVVLASDEEIAINPRARSAKLRIFEKGGLS